MKIKLSNDVSIDLEKLIESRLVFQANSGGGKSHGLRRLIEQSFGHKQIIVLDPEGEFGNMRGKYDFVYCGKDGDAPVESRSAALLARRLLELKASAIIDLYELPMQERKHFVRLFLDSMVNAPKELWHDCIVILDEAHKFAPEKEQSEALEAVADMASRGRKRGYCLIPATQRPAKLNKDVAAECNNKIIGRASLDIDRKRAAEELGFTTKEEIISLRNLEPGEFYCFGPAISREVVKTKIGDIAVPMAKRGQNAKNIPLPTARVKKILGQLADLPQEAKKEADTIQSLTSKNILLERQIKSHSCPIGPDPVKIKEEAERLVAKAKVDIEKSFDEELRRFKEKVIEIKDTIVKLSATASNLLKFVTQIEEEDAIVNVHRPEINISIPLQRKPLSTPLKPIVNQLTTSLSPSEMGSGERRILTAIAQYPDGISREHLTVLTGYKRSSRDTYLQRLRQGGFINVHGEFIVATQEGINVLGSDFQPLPTGAALREHVLNTLPEGERKILAILIEAYPQAVDREALSNAVGYQRSSRDTYLQRLKSRVLIETEGRGMVKANKKLFD